MGLLAILITVAFVAGAGALHFGLRKQLVVLAVASAISVWVAFRAWPALGRTLLAYAVAARIPVALVMLVAIYGNWGTHYDVAPPGGEYVNQMAPIVKWFWIGLVPQATVWIMYTVVLGLIFGALAVGVMKPRAA
jgi:hypothetical protein